MQLLFAYQNIWGISNQGFVVLPDQAQLTYVQNDDLEN